MSCGVKTEQKGNDQQKSIREEHPRHSFDSDIGLRIDTTEYIEFWKRFQNAVISRNVEILSSLIAEELVCDCVTDVSGIYQYGFPLDDEYGKITKSYFIENLDKIFIPEFEKLLLLYDIEKDLYTNRKKENAYICQVTCEEKRYSVFTDFDVNSNRVSFDMSYQYPREGNYFSQIQFLFYKIKEGQIRLLGIGCGAISISG